jgi:hypothetical protein
MKFHIVRRLLVVATISSLALVTPASATAEISPASSQSSCMDVTFNVQTLRCLGFYSGNLIAEGGPKLSEALGYTSNLEPSATSLLEKLNFAGSAGTSSIKFNAPISGDTLVGIYFGAGGTGNSGTAFWLLDVPSGADTLTLSSNASQNISSAGLYFTQAISTSAAIPEPATWITMLFGLSAVGLMMRMKPVVRVRYNSDVAHLA